MAQKQMPSVEEIHRRIDEIDAEMAKLYVSRMQAAAEIAAYKRENGLPVLDAERESEILRRNAEYVQDETLRSYYVGFLKDLMNNSKRYQQSLLEGRKIAFCGVEGAFACMAVRRIFADGVPVPFPSFGEAYASVERGECDCAVLPIENSYSGDVEEVIDLSFFGSLYVTGVYDLEIEQNLLATPGTGAGEIRTVISHPHALRQCAGYIARHGYATETAPNTAVAAQTVAQSGRGDIAAIASTETAQVYGLEIIERGINENKNNTTRFAVFSRAENVKKPEDNQFILFFTVKNEAGALGRAVSLIGEAGFNLKTLRSRPTKHLIWEYYFFVEGKGNIASTAGVELLRRMKEVCSDVRVAGSFPGEVTI